MLSQADEQKHDTIKDLKKDLKEYKDKAAANKEKVEAQASKDRE